MREKGDVPFLGKLSRQPQSPGGNRRKGTPPMLKVITTKAEAPAGEAPLISATLDDLARDGARRMVAAALQLEAAEYVARFREARDEGGRALVVRNGTARPRRRSGRRPPPDLPQSTTLDNGSSGVISVSSALSLGSRTARSCIPRSSLDRATPKGSRGCASVVL
jgi:hypothetical protein